MRVSRIVDTRNLRMESQLVATVKNESNGEVPSIMFRRSNGNTLIRFIPEVPGRHSLQLFCDGQEVSGKQPCSNHRLS